MQSRPNLLGKTRAARYKHKCMNQLNCRCTHMEMEMSTYINNSLSKSALLCNCTNQEDLTESLAVPWTRQARLRQLANHPCHLLYSQPPGSAGCWLWLEHHLTTCTGKALRLQRHIVPIYICITVTVWTSPALPMVPASSIHHKNVEGFERMQDYLPRKMEKFKYYMFM